MFKFLLFLCQTFQIAIVINKYKKVQTGANIQSGGLKKGLFKLEYQGSLKFNVTNPPINEAENVVIAKRVKDKILFFNI